MAKSVPQGLLSEIEQIIRQHPEGLAAGQLHRLLPGPATPLRTLQYRLRQLVSEGRLLRRGEGRATLYIAAPAADAAETIAGSARDTPPPFRLSRQGRAVRDYISQPLTARRPVGYEHGFLGSYRPNQSFYLSAAERAHLAAIGQPRMAELPAGTYARLILNRLLVDLAWNSSRLEGNTYSLLDTRRLIELGEMAGGRAPRETQMILNHRDAIEFLVGAASEIGFNRYTILNLHALLANNLLPDPSAVGRLRFIAVGIERSVFHPLEVPQLIAETFDQLLGKASAIKDPFEQAFFAMVHIPYLQPFDDVNKRVSRLAANIPLIRHNLAPLSFTEVPQQTYSDATLGIYELNDVSLLKDIFLWAYERSADRYAALRQSLGQPDPFRLKYREPLQELVALLVREKVGRTEARGRIAEWTQSAIEAEDRERFAEIAETELIGLHEGNFARYRVRPSEFAAWQEVWRGE